MVRMSCMGRLEATLTVVKVLTVRRCTNESRDDGDIAQWLIAALVSQTLRPGTTLLTSRRLPQENRKLRIQLGTPQAKRAGRS